MVFILRMFGRYAISATKYQEKSRLITSLKSEVALSDSNKTQVSGAGIADTRQVRVENGEIDSQELFQSERELRIRHGAELYRLRRTGLNKLILTK